MMGGFEEIMTLEETGKYIKIGKSPLYKMTKKGGIPAVKIKLRRNNKGMIRQLLEGGIDLRYIQGLLEHRSSNPIEIYIPFNTKILSVLKSPLDRLLAEGKNGCSEGCICEQLAYLPKLPSYPNNSDMNELGDIFLGSLKGNIIEIR